MTLLLLSNSRNPGGEYLAHARDAMAALLGDRRAVWFVPFAGVTVSWDAYTAMVASALAPLGVGVIGAHLQPMPAAGEAVFVGGGNTFQLLAEVRTRALLPIIRGHVAAGAPYAGWSAGANLACPTIRTTNDMPIVDPGGFDALGFVSYQINPHFTNAMPPGHQGETREQRLTEFVTVNPDVHVLGVPEGDWLTVRDGAHVLSGPKDATWIRQGHPPVAVSPGPLPGALVR